MMENIFEQALNLESPWYIKSTNFDYQKKRLDIEIDFTIFLLRRKYSIKIPRIKFVLLATKPGIANNCN